MQNYLIQSTNQHNKPQQGRRDVGKFIVSIFNLMKEDFKTKIELRDCNYILADLYNNKNKNYILFIYQQKLQQLQTQLTDQSWLYKSFFYGINPIVIDEYDDNNEVKQVVNDINFGFKYDNKMYIYECPIKNITNNYLETKHWLDTQVLKIVHFLLNLKKTQIEQQNKDIDNMTTLLQQIRCCREDQLVETKNEPIQLDAEQD